MPKQPEPEPEPIKREAKASTKNTRGSRLPDDWTLPRGWGEWALSQGFIESQIRDQADRFKDYWSAKAGASGLKLDWQATWRNWIRNSKPQFTAINGGKNDRTQASRAINEFADRLADGTISIDYSNRDPFAVQRGGNS